MESLTGYVARLAEAHCLLTATLVRQEIIPVCGKSYFAIPGRLHNFWKSTQSLNGTLAWAEAWVQTLEALTLRNDLRFLTLLTWTEVLPSRNLLRPTRAWCPVCYEEWRRAEQVVYEPLLWTLEVVEACPRHHRRLQTRCPYKDCQKVLPLLDEKARPGYCSHCGRWLGIPQGMPLQGDQDLEEADWEWQTWVTHAVGELLAAAPSLSSPPQGDQLTATISACVEQAAAGNASNLARLLRQPSSTVRQWRRGQVPRLRTMLQICYCLGMSLLAPLTESPGAIDPVQIRPLHS